MNEFEFIDEDTEVGEDTQNSKPSLLTMLILVLMIVALLGSIFWPVLRYSIIRQARPPTPTPQFLQTT